jgi:hypothetical protein
MGKKTLHQNGEKPLGFRGFVMAARVKVVVASVMQPTVEYGHPPNASL